ncbi:MAG: DUF3306 domain-containing protein [Gammaproteobacteria bacterium]|nr:DUF3306 domain-containing protein [Gammaproteobacteria bacterium]
MRHPQDDSGVAHDGTEGQPFLRRWSRRKRGLEQEPEPVEETAGADAAPPAGEPAPVLTDAEMPDLSTIDDHSDLSPFFSSGVSEDLRQAALKRLFRGPKFNIRDGLDDYDEDYRNFEALGDIVTTEMRRQQERLEARLREAEARAEVVAEAPEDTAGPSGDGPVSPAAPAHAGLSDTVGTAAADEDATDGNIGDGHARG